ncbi:MAG: exosortase/archaeosortase family protein [Verrucomicrobiaceae bacterium]|nr:MAG: exosortase/archaeosortase family protein [Verrucomicrobiaceae bacterium]
MHRTNRRSLRELGPAVIAWAALVLLFWRAITWLAATALVREQVGHAAVVLTFGLLFLLRDRPGGNPLELRFDRRAVQFYLGAVVSAGLAALLHEPLLMLCGLGFLAGAVLLFVLGDEVFRPALGFGLAFTGFTALSILFPFADWPLRVLAGKMAGWFLGLLGNPAQFGFTGEPLRLVLVSGGRPFEVAAECNGFGIISGCVLLALLLVFSRRLRVVDKLMILVLAPLLGLISNALRIFLIVLLAPMAGDHYAIMHEAVGVALFFGTLAFVWWLVAGLPERVR